MSRTDLVADVLTMMRNAIMVKKDTVDVPASNTVKSILEILKKQGYIDNYKLMEDNKQGKIKIYLRYIANKPAIRHLQKVSRPGLRRYVRHEEVPSVLRGRGMAIVSTSQGLITDTQAREAGIGGEMIAYIW